MKDRLGDHIAALDLGSNSVLLLLASVDAAGELTEVQEHCAITRLGEGLSHSGRLSPQAMSRTLAAAGEFLGRIDQRGTRGRGIAAATCAVREARNRAEFEARCQDVLGLTPLVFDGASEALTTFRGAVSDRATDEFVLSVDIGGRSTEIAAGTRAACSSAASLDIGCARLAEEYGLLDSAGPAACAAARAAVTAQIAAACRHAERALQDATGARPATIVATGGTATSYAALQLGLREYDRRAVHGLVCARDLLEASAEQLAGMPVAARAALPGMPPERAPVLPAGLLILNAIVRALGQDRFHVSTRGLRFGLAERLHRAEFAPHWVWPGGMSDLARTRCGTLSKPPC